MIYFGQKMLFLFHNAAVFITVLKYKVCVLLKKLFFLRAQGPIFVL
jgi:hypothetical protein